MAEHNLMDYSLLLITEKNPDFKEYNNRDVISNGSVRYQSVKSTNSAIGRQESGNALLRRQPSGIPEVQEDLEDEDDSADYNQVMEKKLSAVGSPRENEGEPKARVQTAAMPKLINIRD